MTNPIVAILKFALICVVLVIFVLSALLKSISNSGPGRLQVLQKHSRKFVRILLRILGIRVRPLNTSLIPNNALIVSNHSSYLDVLAIHLVCPSTFVTSEEIGDTPFLGDLCKASGCLFVNRKSIWNLKNEIKHIVAALEVGANVVVFPEGTTSDGTVVLPFRSSLVEAATISGKKVCPISINYTRINNTAVSLDNRDFVYWYGKMHFLPHLFNLCRLKSMEISICFNEPLSSSSIRNRKVITRQSFATITKKVDVLPAHKPIEMEKFYGAKVIRPGDFSVAR